MITENVIDQYLDMLDAQREQTFAALSGLSGAQIWQRPAPGSWCIGEILNHNHRLMASTMPYIRLAWRLCSWHGRRRRHLPYRTQIPDLYRDGKFPMWVGFLWRPRFNPRRPVPLDRLKTDLRQLHRGIRAFYTGKDEAVLGHVRIYDPYFGWLNLILTLRLGIYHDQLHYDDVIRLSRMPPA